MSFLIEGIDMPECCLECPCYDQYWCNALEENFESSDDPEEGRLANCPIREIHFTPELDGVGYVL